MCLTRIIICDKEVKVKVDSEELESVVAKEEVV